MTALHTKCALCAHFIEENDLSIAAAPPEYRDQIARYVHLDDGDKEHDHDAIPGQSMPLAVWRISRPDLFKTYADGKIGPSSARFTAPR